MRGCLNYLNGDKLQAAKDFQTASSRKDYDIDSRLAADLLLWNRSALVKDADEKLSQSRDYRALTIRAFISMRDNKYSEAITDCNTAIELAPKAPQAYCIRGASYVLRGDAELGLKDLQKSISLDPNNDCHGEQYHYRAIAFDRLGGKVEAEDSRQKAKQLGFIDQEQLAEREALAICRNLCGMPHMD